jgi:nucleotide-binding universal stress UspA family protein
MNKIVIAYDATEAADRALERAAELAKAFGAELVVTSVAPIMVSTARGMGAIDPTDTPQEHHEDLVKAHRKLDEQGIKAQFQPAIGDPADTIVDVAENVGADLIVVGTREPNLLQRLLGQSVSESVQRQAHCDVLIVH